MLFAPFVLRCLLTLAKFIKDSSDCILGTPFEGERRRKDCLEGVGLALLSCVLISWFVAVEKWILLHYFMNITVLHGIHALCFGILGILVQVYSRKLFFSHSRSQYFGMGFIFVVFLCFSCFRYCLPKLFLFFFLVAVLLLIIVFLLLTKMGIKF